MRAVGAPPPRVTPVHRRYKHTCLMVLAPRFHHYSANTWSSSIARYTCTRVPLPSTGTFQSCDLLCLNPEFSPRFFIPTASKFFRERKKKNHRVPFTWERGCITGIRAVGWRGLYGRVLWHDNARSKRSRRETRNDRDRKHGGRGECLESVGRSETERRIEMTEDGEKGKSGGKVDSLSL